jgi:hypothetical protein
MEVPLADFEQLEAVVPLCDRGFHHQPADRTAAKAFH